MGKITPFFPVLPLFMQLNMCPCAYVCLILKTEHIMADSYFLPVSLQVLLCTVCNRDQPLNLSCSAFILSRSLPWSWRDCYRLALVEMFRNHPEHLKSWWFVSSFSCLTSISRRNMATSTWRMMGSVLLGNACSRSCLWIIPKNLPLVTNILVLQGFLH